MIGGSSDEWLDDAACRYRDPMLWFPARGAATAEAKAICRECPVRRPCLELAIDENHRFGIWGGYAAKNRSRLRTRWLREGGSLRSWVEVWCSSS